jgi:hypothetical protein
VGPRVGVNAVENGKMSCHCWEWNSSSLVFELVPRPLCGVCVFYVGLFGAGIGALDVYINAFAL